MYFEIIVHFETFLQFLRGFLMRWSNNSEGAALIYLTSAMATGSPQTEL